MTPFAVAKPAPPRDERIPARLWGLPRRIEQANLAGPRYNQLELSRRAQLAPSVVCRLASWSNLYGLRLDTIYRLARALKVSVAWLLGETATNQVRPAPSARPTPAAPASKEKRERPTHRRLKVSKAPTRRAE